jgi:GTP cyclohydrolase IA
VKEDIVKEAFATILKEGLGFDLEDPNLIDTPRRMAKMYCHEFFRNVHKDFDDFKAFPNTHNYNQIIMSDCIHFVSVCSHHFLPFSGKAWVLYIPKEKLVGASKMSKLVEHYSKRPQLQENLCHEILNRFSQVLDPQGAMVVMRAEHGCMKHRGAQQYNGASLMTSAVYGVFLTDPLLEQKGFDLIRISLMDGGIS